MNITVIIVLVVIFRSLITGRAIVVLSKVNNLDLVGLVTPPLFVHSIKGHRGHEGARKFG